MLDLYPLPISSKDLYPLSALPAEGVLTYSALQHTIHTIGKIHALRSYTFPRWAGGNPERDLICESEQSSHSLSFKHLLADPKPIKSR